jgi:hypothetical protein
MPPRFSRGSTIGLSVLWLPAEGKSTGNTTKNGQQDLNLHTGLLGTVLCLSYGRIPAQNE